MIDRLWCLLVDFCTSVSVLSSIYVGALLPAEQTQESSRSVAGLRCASFLLEHGGQRSNHCSLQAPLASSSCAICPPGSEAAKHAADMMYISVSAVLDFYWGPVCELRKHRSFHAQS